MERINKLIEATARDPYVGVGKPEPLKHALSGFCSRRINEDHRMVHRVEGDQLQIAQLRLHYWVSVISCQRVGLVAIAGSLSPWVHRAFFGAGPNSCTSTPAFTPEAVQ